MKLFFFCTYYLDGVGQSLGIVGFVLPLDFGHVNFAPRHHDPDQCAVVSPHPFHALVQPLGEERRLVLHRFDDRQESVLDISTKLPLDGLFHGVTCQLLVLLEDQRELSATASNQDLVKERLICAPTLLSGFVESLGVGLGLFDIDGGVLVARTAHQQLQQAFEVAAGVVFDVVDELLVVHCGDKLSEGAGEPEGLTLVVGVFGRSDFGVGERAEYLDEDFFVGAETLDGAV
jgi:hypothetical protein